MQADVSIFAVNLFENSPNRAYKHSHTPIQFPNFEVVAVRAPKEAVLKKRNEHENMMENIQRKNVSIYR